MSEGPQNLYNTFVDYEQVNHLRINNIADGKVIQRIAAKSFEMRKRKLKKVLRDRSFNVPEYQRLYSWKTKHHKQFWTDLEQFVEAPLTAGRREVSDVFFSSMYFAVNDEDDIHEVIDGQQRLTTTHILFRTIVEHLEEIDAEEIADDEIRELRKYAIQRIEDLLYRLESFAGPQPRLTLNKHDDEFFSALISGSEAQLAYLCSDEREYIDGRRGDATRVSDYVERFGITDEELAESDTSGLRQSRFLQMYDSHNLLLDAYEFYREKISTVVKEADQTDGAVLALLNLSQFVQHSYHVGEYIIREADSDFRMQIFEILNDRGVDLSKIDRIRAAVVSAFFDTDEKDTYIQKWEDIVVAFATNDNRIVDYLSVYLSIVDEKIETIGEAASELTNAFDTRNIDSAVTPRFGDDEMAREFIGLARDLVDCYQHITNSNLEPSDLELKTETHRQQAQEILVRLNSQQMDQWRPLALAAYYHTDSTSTTDAARFCDLLDTIEKLNLRRLLASERPNIFQEVFIETVHEFGLSPGNDDVTSDSYARAAEFLIDEMRSQTPKLFGNRFLDEIVQRQSWNPKSAKLLFGKITHQHFRKGSGIVDRQLNMTDIHLEHVFPQSPVYDPDDPVWLREFFKTEDGDTELSSVIERYIELVQRDELADEEARQKENISEFITQRFTNDIGNFLLLRDSDNIRASNRPLSEKMPQYYSNVDDFTSIYPNRYFTANRGPIDHEMLERLQTQYETVQEGDRERIEEEVVAYFDSVWTYEAMKDRRVALLRDILEGVGFDSMPDEFGLETNSEAVTEEVRDKTEAEFEKRLSVRTL